MEHASNLGAIIADAIAKPLGIPAFIYDGVTVDEMMPILKITGLKELSRKGIGHNLNTRAAAMKYAREHGKEYKDCKLIVVHLGGGISITCSMVEKWPILSMMRMVHLLRSVQGVFHLRI